LSGHERERLSAFLDGELPSGERAEVESHLAACAECAARLARLSAADDAAAALPAEAPEGYFDTFPSRVRARLESGRKAAVRTRVPAWTWAAAAALLLAVITPLTLRHGLRTEEEARPSASAPAPAGKAERDLGSAAQERPLPPPAATAPSETAPTPAAPAAGSAPRGRLLQAPPPAAEAPPPAAPAPHPAAPAGAAPRETEELAREGLFAREPPSPPARDETARAQVSAREDDSVRQFGGVASEGANRAKAAGAAPEANVTAEATAPMLSAAGAGREARAARFDKEDPFRRLEAKNPRSAAGWRRLREQWSALAAAEANPERADEARVRALVAAREAWRASGDPRDEAVLRAGAEGYLRRDDARQRPRVEGLLAEP
jgi:hypothetical protein